MIITNQGNANQNQNHNKLLYPSGWLLSKNQQLIGEDVKRREPLCMLKLQIGAAIMVNSIEIPQKPKTTSIIQPSNSTSRYLYKENKYICTRMFTAALLTITKIRRQPRCLLVDEWIKMWYTLKYYTTIKKE